MSMDFPLCTAGDAGRIAEMGDHQTARRLAKLTENRFAGESVKAVALNRLSPAAALGIGKNPCDVWHFGMEGGVETGDLRKPREMLLSEADDSQRGGGVQRRECRCGFQFIENGPHR